MAPAVNSPNGPPYPASAIAAHVICDLGRAIRYAYNHRFNPSIAKNDANLMRDFNLTDVIFKDSKTNALEDVTYAFNRNSPSLVPSGIDYLYTDFIKWMANYDDGILVGAGNEAYQEYTRAFNFFDVHNIVFTDAEAH